MTQTEFKKIVLVEIDFHNEVVKAIALQLLSQKVKLVIATTDFVYQNIPDLQNEPRIKWKIKLKEQSNYEFLAQTLSNNEEADSFIFNGFQKIESAFLDLNIPSNAHYILHDLHSIYEPHKNLLFRKDIISKVKDLIKFLLFVITNQRKRNHGFVSLFNKILLPASSVLKYNERQDFVNQETGLAKFAIHEKLVNPDNENVINIVIPGTIIEKSRDYFPVIQAFKKIYTRIDQSIKIILLGRAVDSYGRAVINSFNKLSSSFVTIQTFDSFINQDTFDKILANAHFLILPTQRYMRFNFFKELNSQSCVSGNVNDMVRYGKPSLLPRYYLLDNELDELTERYSNEKELSLLLLDWINEKRFRKKIERAEQVLEKEGVASNGKALLELILN